jgi:hypothetical protein
MHGIYSYSLPNMLRVYNKNKHAINAELRGSCVENYNFQGKTAQQDAKYLGMSVNMFIAVLIISFILWAAALYWTVKYWKVVPDWSKTVAVIGLVFGFPVASLISIGIGKHK